jgi:L-asparaginase
VTGKKIAVLATGGTLAGKAAAAGDNIGYTAAQVGIGELLAAIPPLRDRPFVSEQVAQVDSKDMDFATWRQLALRCEHWLADEEVAGLVITHGTDTLEETAYFLQRVLAPAKPVVLTCAMRPATALVPDGPQNLVDAFVVAGTAGARGVVAVCAGAIHGPFDVAKAHTYRLDAFTSGDAGPIGYVEEGGLRLLRAWPAPDRAAASVLRRFAGASGWPRVEIVMNYAGAGRAVVDALVAQGVDGIVAAGTGNGTLNGDMQAALLEAQGRGVKVVRATRCAGGRVLSPAGARLPDSAGLSPVKARVALLLELVA